MLDCSFFSLPQFFLFALPLFAAGFSTSFCIFGVMLIYLCFINAVCNQCK